MPPPPARELASARAAARDGAITAKGFASRPLRRRSSRTAASLRASTTRWKPPSPLRARMWPVRTASAAPRSASSREARVVPSGLTSWSWGPHTPQAMGSAWKRRSVGVLVFVAAPGAHREARHGGAGAVVGQAQDDAVARAAVGAVEEGVAEAPVRGIAELAQTVGAGRDVGQHQGGSGSGAVARADGEGVVADGGEGGGRELQQERARRQLGPEPPRKRREVLRSALDLDGHALRRVQDEAGEIEAAREAIHERPEAHALDGALGVQPQAADRARGCRGHRGGAHATDARAEGESGEGAGRASSRRIVGSSRSMALATSGERRRPGSNDLPSIA